MQSDAPDPMESTYNLEIDLLLDIKKLEEYIETGKQTGASIITVQDAEKTLGQRIIQLRKLSKNLPSFPLHTPQHHLRFLRKKEQDITYGPSKNCEKCAFEYSNVEDTATYGLIELILREEIPENPEELIKKIDAGIERLDSEQRTNYVFQIEDYELLKARMEALPESNKSTALTEFYNAVRNIYEAEGVLEHEPLDCTVGAMEHYAGNGLFCPYFAIRPSDKEIFLDLDKQALSIVRERIKTLEEEIGS